MKLTKANMAKIEAGFAASLSQGKTDVIVFDDTLKRFGLRLRSSGRRSWIIQYEKWGTSRRVTLGNAAVLSPEQARQWAVQELAKLDLGADVAGDRAEAKVKAKRLLKSVVEQYLQARQGELRETSFKEVRRYLLKTFKPLHHKPISEIQRGDVASILRDMVNKGSPVAATTARSVLATFFAWAIGEELVDANPVAGTNRAKSRKSRERVLNDAELSKVWNACHDDEYGKIVRLLILTGARRDEIGGMQWQELDPDNHTWTLPADRSKNHRPLKLPLPGLAWGIIDNTNQRGGNNHLFGIGKNGFNNFHSTKQALHRRSGVFGWTLHDLRRSTATGMADIGVQPHIIEAVLNHVSGHKAGVAGIYNRSSYEREVRNALAAWADHVREIATGVAPTVVPLRGVS